MHYLIAYDKALFLYLNTASWLRADAFWLFMSSKAAWLIYSVPVALLLIVKLRRAFISRLFVILLLFLVTDQTANLFKNNIRRPRPCREPGLLADMHFINGHCSEYGYFSGHAANSMGLVFFCSLLLGTLFPRYRTAVWTGGLLFVFMVSFSRVMVGVHYPLDIVSGWLWGAFCASLLYRGLLYLQKRRDTGKAAD